MQSYHSFFMQKEKCQDCRIVYTTKTKKGYTSKIFYIQWPEKGNTNFAMFQIIKNQRNDNKVWVKRSPVHGLSLNISPRKYMKNTSSNYSQV
jgi:hypothetical protein